MTASQVEIRTVERAILCANQKIHYGNEMFDAADPALLLSIADNTGTRHNKPCGPHSFATRERIVTGWTEANT